MSDRHVLRLALRSILPSHSTSKLSVSYYMWIEIHILTMGWIQRQPRTKKCLEWTCQMKFMTSLPLICRSHFSASAVLVLLVNIVRKLMLARHRLAPTTAFVSIYRKDTREIVISAYVHTVSFYFLNKLWSFPTFSCFHFTTSRYILVACNPQFSS